MAALPTTTVRNDPALKDQANEIFGELGTSSSAAGNVYLKAVVRHKDMPLELSLEKVDENGE